MGVFVLSILSFLEQEGKEGFVRYIPVKGGDRTYRQSLEYVKKGGGLSFNMPNI